MPAVVMMPRKDYLAEHSRLEKVLKGAKTAAAAKELARQKMEVKKSTMGYSKPHSEVMMKSPMMGMMRHLEY